MAVAIGPSGTGSGITAADGGGGRGLSKTILNSLNSFSRPGCICLAIIGKLFNRSLKDLMSFFLGNIVEGVPGSTGELIRAGKRGLPSDGSIGRIAGVILTSSNIPSNGLEI
jgi:hypothetical protein